ncbi:MAG: hypothetical protein IIY94_03205 [Oscillospiraceae bacterium]|nr:hypothetical protein [Oscillospiraceae bacterium]
MKTTDIQRNQFTFYRSYYEAVLLLPKSRQLEALQAIIQYALDGEMPETLSPKSYALLTAIRPNLDIARLKASTRLKANAALDIFPSGRL